MTREQVEAVLRKHHVLIRCKDKDCGHYPVDSVHALDFVSDLLSLPCEHGRCDRHPEPENIVCKQCVYHPQPSRGALRTVMQILHNEGLVLYKLATFGKALDHLMAWARGEPTEAKVWCNEIWWRDDQWMTLDGGTLTWLVVPNRWTVCPICSTPRPPSVAR